MVALVLPTLHNAFVTAGAFAAGGLFGWLVWLAVRGLGETGR